jgi:CheY-like chemotaxis protein
MRATGTRGGTQSGRPEEAGAILKGPTLLPFYHPTRVVFVDDEPRAVRYHTHALRRTTPVSYYGSALDLLRDIENGRLPMRIELDCFSDYSGLVTDAELERVFGVDRTMIIKRLFAADRFSTMGVVVIDYAMPDLDGLTLCRRLEDHAQRFGYTPARRIMLTARADASLGMEALNEGLIAAFYRKDRPDLMDALDAQIKAQQRAFIAEVTRGLRDLLSWDDPVPGEPPGFRAWFSELCMTRGIVEYYAVFAPGRGYLMLDAAGEPSLLLLFSEREISSQYEAARTAGAPMDVLQMLRRRTHALYFGDEVGTRVMSPRNWRYGCLELRPCPGRYDAFYALPDHCRPHTAGLERVTPLRRALAADPLGSVP